MEQNKTALIVFPVKRQSDRARFEKALPEHRFFYLEDGPISDELFAEAEVIFGNSTAEMLAPCKKLKWLQLGSAGADSYVVKGLLPEGTMLTNATGAYGDAIGEYMVAVTFALCNHLPLYRDNQMESQWIRYEPGRAVEGSTVLCVGMGDIGGAYAKRMKALGCTVYGIRRTKSAAPDYVDGLFQLDMLDELLPKADIVALSLPNSAQTRGLITKERLALMKNDAFLINIGRGTAICTDALVEALRNNTIGGAAMDVTDPEPLPSDHPLWKCKNALITPHISGGFGQMRVYDTFISICLENVEHFKAGEEMRNVVDFSTGYRKS